MAHHAHAAQAGAAMARHAAGGMAMGTAAVAAKQSGKGFWGGLARHPLLVFSLGIAVGYLIHRYRKEIIQSAAGLTGDGAAHGMQSLDDLVAEECSECADGGAAASSGQS